MEIKKVIIGFASKNDIPTSLEKSFPIFNRDDIEVSVIPFKNNTDPLPKVYNKLITIAKELDCDALILSHDDVSIIDESFFDKLSKLFDEYDLIGVAGTSKATIKSPALWHLMGGGFSGGHLHGCVYHKPDTGNPYPTVFGKYPHRVVMIDGVLMAIGRNLINFIEFDETNPSGFHFYDLDTSISVHNKGFKVGVGDISIIHESPGLRSFNPEWIAGEKWFLNKHS